MPQQQHQNLQQLRTAGAAPIIYGLLSDLFPPSQRACATTCVVVSQGAGASVGQIIAGGFTGLDWRMPFVIVSVPALLVAALTARTCRDPVRGSAEPALQPAVSAEGFVYDEHLSWRKIRQLCTTHTNVLVILQVRSRHLIHVMCAVQLTWFVCRPTGWVALCMRSLSTC